MPVNLNAFIRYKTIDSCLKNQFVTCDIEYLIRKCSEAISNKAGEIRSVSERTVRNDIKVLRSDILGFNAPIVCIDRVYKYSESDYSIFNTPIIDKELLVEIQNLLIEEFDRINSAKVKTLIVSLASVTGEKLPEKFTPKDSSIFETKIFTSSQLSAEEIYQAKINKYLKSLQDNKTKPKKKSLASYFKLRSSSPELFKWDLVFEFI